MHTRLLMDNWIISGVPDAFIFSKHGRIGCVQILIIGHTISVIEAVPICARLNTLTAITRALAHPRNVVHVFTNYCC